MKIVVGEFIQETNSFCPVNTTMEDFILRGILEGEEIRQANADKLNALGGMLTALKEAEAEVVLSYAMTAQSGGKVEHQIEDHFLAKLLPVIRASMPVDGVFLSCHGATQTTQTDDGVGYILSAVRAEIGDEPVIAISTDLHANITEQIIHAADIVCGYHTYPHIDFFETGYRAAKLGLECCKKGPDRPVMAWCSAPMIVPASVYTTNDGPFADLINDAKALQAKGEFLDFSIYQMQPWLDVNAGGSAALVVARDGSVAKCYARKFVQRLYDIRDTFQAHLTPVDEILRRAANAPAYAPVVLGDSADSSNAGAAGDSAEVLRALLKFPQPIKAALIINDAPAAVKAKELGVGAEAEFSIGGTVDPMRQPVVVRAKVRSLHDGDFIQEGPAGRGLVRHIGLTAVLRAGAVDIIVASSMTGNGDPQLFRNFGVEPIFYQLVAVKACTSYRAAFSLFASEICEADTPGAATTQLTTLPFTHLPASFYPFENTSWTAPEALLAHQ